MNEHTHGGQRPRGHSEGAWGDARSVDHSGDAGYVERTEFEVPTESLGTTARGGLASNLKADGSEGHTQRWSLGHDGTAINPNAPAGGSASTAGNWELSAQSIPGDQDVETSLRPQSLDEFIGQKKVRQQLDLVLGGARARNVTPDHVLLAGPPGLGKTTMAMIIAQEMGSALRMTSGPALERAGDLAAMLSNLMEGDVLFIDEIHRIARPAEEMLYMAMEDFRIDVIVGKGPGATSIPLEIAPFTLVGATTRAGMLTGPLRDRFGFTAQMEFYDAQDLTRVVLRAAGILGVDISQEASAEIARRSRGTPRIANRLLRRVRDFADVHSGGRITLDVARRALVVFDVDEQGLDRLDRAVLDALVRGHGGGPVGVNTLALAVGEEPSTVEEVCEPYLVRAGMIARTPRGRVATAQAWHYAGLEPPENAPGLLW